MEQRTAAANNPDRHVQQGLRQLKHLLLKPLDDLLEAFSPRVAFKLLKESGSSYTTPGPHQRLSCWP